MDDWISSLAKQATSSSNIPTKQERQQKRAAKKARREAKRPQQQHSQETKSNSSARRSQSQQELAKQQQKRRAAISKQRIHSLKQFFRALLEAHIEEGGRPTPYQGSNNPKIKKRKANWDDPSLIQPRRNDYGGIGLARASLYLPFVDPAFFPKLEEEFNEHIEGFYGRTHTKAMKRQLGKDMLWRKMAEQKTSKVKVNGKKLSDMTPDERVQAMIDNGLV